jgi:aspartate/methionine/tyrosine aminotransferase
MREVLVTGGANGALSSYIMALCNEGDELVAFEPAFPLYFDHLDVAGGTIKTVPLEEKDGHWNLNVDALRAVLSERTKVLVINTPHNPTGKCFTLEEQTQISEVLIDFPNVVVIADEVYDRLIFDSGKHVPFASIGDNWNKTVSVYSGGKLFLATGWKVGWVIGPESIVRLGGIINNTTAYCTNNPAQMAFARALDHVHRDDDTFLDDTRRNFEEVRNFLSNEIREMDLPWEPLPCPSGYFLMADVTKCRYLIPKVYFETHEYEPGFTADSVNDSDHIVKNVLYMPS